MTRGCSPRQRPQQWSMKLRRPRLPAMRRPLRPQSPRRSADSLAGAARRTAPQQQTLRSRLPRRRSLSPSPCHQCPRRLRPPSPRPKLRLLSHTTGSVGPCLRESLGRAISPVRSRRPRKPSSPRSPNRRPRWPPRLPPRPSLLQHSKLMCHWSRPQRALSLSLCERSAGCSAGDSQSPSRMSHMPTR
ncbi:MAG: hypothetical protein BWY79_01959 [Actinobacteria bacterium ADurb.Bin444]|nr:MAG: hypothetical protein BWY79_01959 [Actinobacteria bacterium ADurb.Bin444]